MDRISKFNTTKGILFNKNVGGVMVLEQSFTKISQRVLELFSGLNFLIENFQMRHNSLKMLVELQFLLSANRLIMLHICIK